EGISVIPQMRVYDPKTGDDRELRLINTQGQAARPDELGRIMFSQTEVYKNFYPFQDLYDYDSRTDNRERLTHGARARDPDVTRDGRFVYFVQSLGVSQRLMRASLVEDRSGLRKLGPLEVVWDPGYPWQMYAPRVSPDGK